MKRLGVFTTALVLTATLTGCGGGTAPPTDTPESSEAEKETSGTALAPAPVGTWERVQPEDGRIVGTITDTAPLEFTQNSDDRICFVRDGAAIGGEPGITGVVKDPAGVTVATAVGQTGLWDETESACTIEVWSDSDTPITAMDFYTIEAVTIGGLRLEGTSKETAVPLRIVR